MLLFCSVFLILISSTQASQFANLSESLQQFATKHGLSEEIHVNVNCSSCSGDPHGALGDSIVSSANEICFDIPGLDGKTYSLYKQNGANAFHITAKFSVNATATYMSEIVITDNWLSILINYQEMIVISAQTGIVTVPWGTDYSLFMATQGHTVASFAGFDHFWVSLYVNFHFKIVKYLYDSTVPTYFLSITYVNNNIANIEGLMGHVNQFSLLIAPNPVVGNQGLAVVDGRYGPVTYKLAYGTHYCWFYTYPQTLTPLNPHIIFSDGPVNVRSDISYYEV